MGIRFGSIVAAILAASLVPARAQDDWPTYQHDAGRTGITSARLDAARVAPAWNYAAPSRIRPAWSGPDERDYYNSPTVDNEDRLDLDLVFHVAAVGDSVYFGSSTEDSLRCLDARTGDSRWAFTTDGPVRFAPHVVDGWVYFGADDGCIYCVSAADGALRWRRRIAESDYVVPSDGKWVSLWPNRTGVIVRDGLVYCGVGVFPAEGVYVATLDAATGEPRSSQRYTDMSLQGYVLVSDSNVFFPGGRAGPWVFDRAAMGRKGQLGGGGGTYAVITDSQSLIYGPGRTSAVLEEFGGETHDSIATFPGAKHIIATQECSYIATKDKLFAFDRIRHRELTQQIAALTEERKALDASSAAYAESSGKIEAATAEREKCRLWTVASPLCEALILAGDTVIAGGRDAVAAFSAKDGARVFSAEVSGTAKGLAVARGRLFVSTDASRIYCFAAR